MWLCLHTCTRALHLPRCRVLISVHFLLRRAADVWSLAIMFIELCIGRDPIYNMSPESLSRLSDAEHGGFIPRNVSEVGWPEGVQRVHRFGLGVFLVPS